MKRVSLASAWYAAYRLMVSRISASLLLGICGFLLSENPLVLVGGYIIGDDIHFSLKMDAAATVVYTVMYCILFILQTSLSWPLYRCTLDLIDEPTASLTFSLPNKSQLTLVILATVVSSLYTFAGFLLIIPGIIIAARLSFYLFLIVDSHGRAPDVLQQSWRITQGHVMRLLVFLATCSLLNGLFLACASWALVMVIPLQWYATAHLYRQLVASAQLQDDKIHKTFI